MQRSLVTGVHLRYATNRPQDPLNKWGAWAIASLGFHLSLAVIAQLLIQSGLGASNAANSDGQSTVVPIELITEIETGSSKTLGVPEAAPKAEPITKTTAKTTLTRAPAATQDNFQALPVSQANQTYTYQADTADQQSTDQQSTDQQAAAPHTEPVDPNGTLPSSLPSSTIVGRETHTNKVPSKVRDTGDSTAGGAVQASSPPYLQPAATAGSPDGTTSNTVQNLATTSGQASQPALGVRFTGHGVEPGPWDVPEQKAIPKTLSLAVSQAQCPIDNASSQALAGRAVRMSVVIDAVGTVESATAQPSLGDARQDSLAVCIAKSWTFHPAMNQGQSVASTGHIEFTVETL